MQGDCTDFLDLMQLVRLQRCPNFDADVLPAVTFGADVSPAMTLSMQGDCTDFLDLMQLVRLQGSPIFGADVFACGDFVNAGRLH